MNEENEVVWTDGGTVTATGQHFFLAQITKTSSTIFFNSGNGSMTGTALKAGTYKWTIKMDNTELGHGEFTVK